MKGCESSSFKLERKTLEKNRRMHMKNLCFKLASLIPSHYSQRPNSVQDQLEQATVHIRMLHKKLEVLKQKRAVLASAAHISGGMMMGLRLPVIEVRESGSRIEVELVTGSNKNFTLSDVISVLEEGGAQVVNATFSCSANMVFHLIHSKVTSSRVGFESAMVQEKLKELINRS